MCPSGQTRSFVKKKQSLLGGSAGAGKKGAVTSRGAHPMAAGSDEARARARTRAAPPSSRRRVPRKRKRGKRGASSRAHGVGLVVVPSAGGSDGNKDPSKSSVCVWNVYIGKGTWE